MIGKKLTVISVYSGGGGLDLGFRKAGYDILYSTDYWEPACKTLRNNFPDSIIECNDIRKINFKEVLRKTGKEEIDCLIGGPPCPAYSKSRFYRKDKKRALEDENSFTLSEYFRAVKELQPRVFFFENVHGFVYKPHFEAFQLLKQKSVELGYKLSYKVINTADYGIPQTRERFICIGVKNNLPNFTFPRQTHYDPNKENLKKFIGLKKWVTCKDVLEDLDFSLPEDKKRQAGSKHKDLLKEIPPGENYLYFTKERGYKNPKFKWRSRYWSFLLKLSPERPSWTIQASHSNNMGPFHWRNRFLRIPEIKRIQTFDDNYNFFGDFKTQWRQVGNAVPPLLAKTIAEEIKKILK